MNSLKPIMVIVFFFGVAIGTDGVARAQKYRGNNAEFVTIFNDTEYPEGLDMGSDGTLYAGILLTGEVKAVNLDGSQRTVGTVELDGGVMPGLTLSDDGEIFLAATAPTAGSDGHGILRMTKDGDVSEFAAFPTNTSPNHITFNAAGDMLVSESNPGSIYHVDGITGAVTLWSDNPRLLGYPVPELGGLPLGANGSVLSDDETVLYVSNSSTSEILAIAIEPDGSAGELWCYAGAAFDCEVNTAATVAGPDGLALDADGNMYIASGANNAIVRIDQDDAVVTLWSGYPLEWPAVLRFGASRNTRHSLFSTNLDASHMFGGEGTPVPGIVRIHVRKQHSRRCENRHSGHAPSHHCRPPQASGHGRPHCNR